MGTILDQEGTDLERKKMKIENPWRQIENRHNPTSNKAKTDPRRLLALRLRFSECRRLSLESFACMIIATFFFLQNNNSSLLSYCTRLIDFGKNLWIVLCGKAWSIPSQSLLWLFVFLYLPCAVNHSTTWSMLVMCNAEIGNTIQGVSTT